MIGWKEAEQETERTLRVATFLVWAKNRLTTYQRKAHLFDVESKESLGSYIMSLETSDELVEIIKIKPHEFFCIFSKDTLKMKTRYLISWRSRRQL